MRRRKHRQLRLEALEDRRMLASDLYFDTAELQPHHPWQDISGTFSASEKTELHMEGNLWKALPLDYEFTPRTMLELNFASNNIGELHGIGVVDAAQSDFIPSDDLVVLAGTQPFYGNRDYQTYLGGGAEQRFVIPIGEFFQGRSTHLVFGNDHDVESPDATSVFSDIKIYETLAVDQHPIVSYGGAVDQGQVSTSADGVLELSGNARKALLYSYSVSPQTILEFDLEATSDAAPIGIGWDNDLAVSADWFQLTGGPAVGNQDFGYDVVGTRQTFQIPLGQYVQGDIQYLTFFNDDAATSRFSRIRLYEPEATMAPASYGGQNQDVNGSATVIDDDHGVTLTGNTWKSIPYRYEVTADTVIEVDFKSSIEGELQGIGFDDDDSLNSERFFVLAGTQTFFGNRDYQTATIGETQRYTIPLGQYFQGPITRLTFGNDHDVASPTAQATFRNVRMYESDADTEAAVWSYDVVVYGGTSGGVAAAVEAARLGKSVALIEPSVRVGGTTASGLGLADVGHRGSLGGISSEFFERVHDYYSDDANWIYQDAADYSHFNPSDSRTYRFEPHVAEQIFNDMLDEELVAVITERRMDRSPTGVQVNDLAIQSLDLEGTGTFRGQQFIDSSYEGDLMAAAGVTYTVGREANSQYGETLNGVIYNGPYTFYPVHPVDAYVVPGDPDSGLIAGVLPQQTAATGSASTHMQAFNYRLTLTDVPENRLPFSQPAGYDEADYELLLRYFEAGNEIRPFSLHRMPNLKTDSNGAAIVSTDLAGANWDYAEASYAERELILQEHRDYIEGLLWTVQNHPRIPQSVRNSYASWGYAKDEFLENDNFPTQIYVREARRMVSDYIVTELDARRLRIADDPIAIASYPLDSHFTGVHVGDDGTVTGEGSFYYPAGGPFFVSYQSIVPRQGEVTNLAVTSAISASHAAYGAVRMEPVYMMMGHSAGAAASLAIDNQVAMQEVDYSQLKTLLVNEGQVLTLPHWAEPREIYTADTLPGVVVDDFDATFTGDNHWGVSYWPWVDGMYSNDLKAAKGDWTATFETPLSGAYEVRVLFPSHAGNATNVPVTVHHAGGWTSYAVDQTTAGNYVSLGPFTFGASAKVVLDNTGTDGLVIADAVQFLPIL